MKFDKYNTVFARSTRVNLYIIVYLSQNTKESILNSFGRQLVRNYEQKPYFPIRIPYFRMENISWE